MHRYINYIIIFFIALNGCSIEPDDNLYSNSNIRFPHPNATVNDYHNSNILVKLLPADDSDSIAKAVSGKIIKTLRMKDYKYIVVELPIGLTSSAALSILESESGYIMAEPNYKVKMYKTPNDAYFNDQYSHHIAKSTNAWDITTGTNEVTVAIIDTGVKSDHPDLSANIISGYDFINDTVLVAGMNSDGNGHGTHVAGIACAKGDNSIGISGIAWDCNIMPIKALDDSGSGYFSDIAQAIIWAADNQNGKRLVINLSLGSEYYTQILQDAVSYAMSKNAVVVAAMGNESIHLVTYPAYCTGVIAVGSTDTNDSISDFSTKGNFVSVSAPGEGILSTISTLNDDITSPYYNSYYAIYSGTSMASPFVAGLAALLLSKDNTLTASQIKTIIENTSVDLGVTGYDPLYGFGRVDAGAALNALKDDKYGSMLVYINNNGVAIDGLEVLICDSNTNVIRSAKTSVFNNSLNTNGTVYFHFINYGDYLVRACIGDNCIDTLVSISNSHTLNNPLFVPVNFNLSDNISVYSSMNITGPFNNWNSISMTRTSAYTWSFTGFMNSSDEFMFLSGNSDYWGDIDEDGIADKGFSQPNIICPISGSVKIVFNDFTKAYSISN